LQRRSSASGAPRYLAPGGNFSQVKTNLTARVLLLREISLSHYHFKSYQRHSQTNHESKKQSGKKFKQNDHTIQKIIFSERLQQHLHLQHLQEAVFQNS